MDGKFLKRVISFMTLVAFVCTSVPSSYAQSLSLPQPGTMVSLSTPYQPPVLQGVKVYADNPFQLDFILNKGASMQSEGALKDESNKLVKYFLAALTVPENDLWVNLSPYEKERIVPEAFGQTGMGRDLLAQDYLLKQITASVIYPEGETGKKFWAEVYKKAQEKYGTTDIPVDTFNKVWIVPEKAVVYEKAENAGHKAQDDQAVAYIVESKLKVMLEADYLAIEKAQDTGHTAQDVKGVPESQEFTKNIIREIVIPILEKEVNEGANFAPLRQVYQALILAAWYKKKIKESILSKVYVDQKKVQGINIDDPQETQKIWGQYVEAFKKGAYNYIKEEQDPATQELIPRKYFSGGANFNAKSLDLKVTHEPAMISGQGILAAALMVLSMFLTTPSRAAAGDTRPMIAAVAADQVATQPQRTQNKLFYPDGSVMLGEKEPGIAYYPVGKSFKELLDVEDGGLGDAKKIAASFKVLRIYMWNRAQMEELEGISKKIFEQYQIKMKIIFSPYLLGLFDKDDKTLKATVDEFVERLGQHPWILIQVGNEDHYYLKGGFLVKEGYGIRLTKKQYYAYYDKVAGLLKAKLREKLPDQRPKPILLGQGFALERDEREMEEAIEGVKSTHNFDGVSVNAYLSFAQAYGPFVEYLQKRLEKPLVIGEFGWSSYNTTQEAQNTFVRQSWHVLEKEIKAGKLAGAVVFAYNNKNEGDAAEGSSEAFKPYDIKFGIKHSVQEGVPYLSQSDAPPQVNPAFGDDASFWKATQDFTGNREFFAAYVARNDVSAADQGKDKREALRKAASSGKPLTDEQRHRYHELNFTGAAYYYLGTAELFGDQDFSKLRTYYQALRGRLANSQMYYGPGAWWSPADALEKNIRLLLKISTGDQRKTLEDILAQGASKSAERAMALDDQGAKKMAGSSEVATIPGSKSVSAEDIAAAQGPGIVLMPAKAVRAGDRNILSVRQLDLFGIFPSDSDANWGISGLVNELCSNATFRMLRFFPSSKAPTTIAVDAFRIAQDKGLLRVTIRQDKVREEDWRALKGHEGLGFERYEDEASLRRDGLAENYHGAFRQFKKLTTQYNTPATLQYTRDGEGLVTTLWVKAERAMAQDKISRVERNADGSLALTTMEGKKFTARVLSEDEERAVVEKWKTAGGFLANRWGLAFLSDDHFFVEARDAAGESVGLIAAHTDGKFSYPEQRYAVAAVEVTEPFRGLGLSKAMEIRVIEEILARSAQYEMGIVAKDQFGGLKRFNGNDVLGILTANRWADADEENSGKVHLRAHWEEGTKRMSEIFGDDFPKILRILKQSYITGDIAVLPINKPSEGLHRDLGFKPYAAWRLPPSGEMRPYEDLTEEQKKEFDADTESWWGLPLQEARDRVYGYYFLMKPINRTPVTGKQMLLPGFEDMAERAMTADDVKRETARIEKKQADLFEYAKSLEAKFSAKFPWLQWVKAAEVPFPETQQEIKSGEENGPKIEKNEFYGSAQNRFNYWANQIDVRRLFLEFLETALDQGQPLTSMQARLYLKQGLHHLILGSKGDSKYLSPTLLEREALGRKVPLGNLAATVRLTDYGVETYAHRLNTLIKQLTSPSRSYQRLNRDFFNLYRTFIIPKYPQETKGLYAFAYGNNSFAMNNINAIRRLTGRPGTSHNYADILVLRNRNNLSKAYAYFDAVLDGKPLDFERAMTARTAEDFVPDLLQKKSAFVVTPTGKKIILTLRVRRFMAGKKTPTQVSIDAFDASKHKPIGWIDLSFRTTPKKRIAILDRSLSLETRIDRQEVSVPELPAGVSLDHFREKNAPAYGLWVDGDYRNQTQRGEIVDRKADNIGALLFAAGLGAAKEYGASEMKVDHVMDAGSFYDFFGAQNVDADREEETAAYKLFNLNDFSKESRYRVVTDAQGNIQGYQAPGDDAERAMGIEYKHFKAPVVTKQARYSDENETRSFLDRHQLQGKILRERVMPGIMERNRAQKKIDIAILGVSSAEETARIFHEIMKFLEDSKVPDPSSWAINIKGYDIDPEMIKFGEERIRGDEPFGSQGGGYADEIMGTLERYPDKFRQSVQLIEQDISNISPLELENTDLVVLNHVLRTFTVDADKISFVKELSKKSPQAVIAQGDLNEVNKKWIDVKFKAHVFVDPLEYDNEKTRYVFGLPFWAQSTMEFGSPIITGGVEEDEDMSRKGLKQPYKRRNNRRDQEAEYAMTPNAGEHRFVEKLHFEWTSPAGHELPAGDSPREEIISTLKDFLSSSERVSKELNGLYGKTILPKDVQAVNVRYQAMGGEKYVFKVEFVFTEVAIKEQDLPRTMEIAEEAYKQARPEQEVDLTLEFARFKRLFKNEVANKLVPRLLHFGRHAFLQEWIKGKTVLAAGRNTPLTAGGLQKIVETWTRVGDALSDEGVLDQYPPDLNAGNMMFRQEDVVNPEEGDLVVIDLGGKRGTNPAEFIQQLIKYYVKGEHPLSVVSSSKEDYNPIFRGIQHVLGSQKGFDFFIEALRDPKGVLDPATRARLTSYLESDFLSLKSPEDHPATLRGPPLLYVIARVLYYAEKKDLTDFNAQSLYDLTRNQDILTKTRLSGMKDFLRAKLEMETRGGKKKIQRAAPELSVIIEEINRLRDQESRKFESAMVADSSEIGKTVSAMEQRLLDPEIRDSKKIDEGRSGAVRITLGNGQEAVWKSDRPGIQSGDYEIAAYRLNRLLGLQSVPVTVRRSMAGEEGIIQQFMDGEEEYLKKSEQDFKDDLGTEKMRDMQVFWYLIGDRDKDFYLTMYGYVMPNNYFIHDGEPVSIDHGLAFQAVTDPGDFLDPVRPEIFHKNIIPSPALRGRLEALRKMGKENIRAFLSDAKGQPLISDVERFDAFWERLGIILDRKTLTAKPVMTQDVNFAPKYYQEIFPALERAIVSGEGRKFATFSGLSGSGKTSITEAFAEYLRKKNHAVVVIEGDDFCRFHEVKAEYIFKKIYVRLLLALPRMSLEKVFHFIFEKFFVPEDIRQFVTRVNNAVDGEDILYQTPVGEKKIRLEKNSIVLVEEMFGADLFAGLPSPVNIFIKRDLEKAKGGAAGRLEASGDLTWIEKLNIRLNGTRHVESYMGGLIKKGKFNLVLDVNDRDNPFLVPSDSIVVGEHAMMAGHPESAVSGALEQQRDQAMPFASELSVERIVKAHLSKQIFEVRDKAGRHYFLKCFVNEGESRREYFAYKVAGLFGVHVPRSQWLSRDQFSGIEGLDVRKSYQFAILTQSVHEMEEKDLNPLEKDTAGIEAVAAFTHFMRYNDWVGNGNSVTRKIGGKERLILLDLAADLRPDAWSADPDQEPHYTRIQGGVAYSWTHYLSQIDLNRLNAIVKRVMGLPDNTFQRQVLSDNDPDHESMSLMMGLDFVKDRQRDLRKNIIDGLRAYQKSEWADDMKEEVRTAIDYLQKGVSEVAPGSSGQSANPAMTAGAPLQTTDGLKASEVLERNKARLQVNHVDDYRVWPVDPEEQPLMDGYARMSNQELGAAFRDLMERGEEVFILVKPLLKGQGDEQLLVDFLDYMTAHPDLLREFLGKPKLNLKAAQDILDLLSSGMSLSEADRKELRGVYEPTRRNALRLRAFMRELLRRWDLPSGGASAPFVAVPLSSATGFATSGEAITATSEKRPEAAMISAAAKKIWGRPFKANNGQSYYFDIKPSSTKGWLLVKVREEGKKRIGSIEQREISFKYESGVVTDLRIVLPPSLRGADIGSQFYRRLAEVLPEGGVLESYIENRKTREFLAQRVHDFSHRGAEGAVLFVDDQRQWLKVVENKSAGKGEIFLGDLLGQTLMGRAQKGFGDNQISVREHDGRIVAQGLKALRLVKSRESGGMVAKFYLRSVKGESAMKRDEKSVAQIVPDGLRLIAGDTVDVTGVNDWVVVNGWSEELADQVIVPNIASYRNLKGEQIKEITGLKNKALVRIPDGPSVFMADDHNFSFPFWWLAAEKGWISSKGNRLLHIDAHADAEIMQRYRATPKFLGSGSKKLTEADAYGLNALGIQGFITPFVEDGLIADWRWLFNMDTMQAVRMGPGDALRYKIETGSAQDVSSETFDIVDIDIDVLNGIPQEQIEKALDYFAALARKAKIVSIVTSPNFIHQDKAVEYARRLLDKIAMVPIAQAKPSLKPEDFMFDLGPDRKSFEPGDLLRSNIRMTGGEVTATIGVLKKFRNKLEEKGIVFSGHDHLGIVIGPGYSPHELVTLGNDEKLGLGKVYGVEAQERWLGQAAQDLVSQGADPKRFQLIHADAKNLERIVERLPAADQKKVSLVYGNASILSDEDAEGIIPAVYQILAPGGVAYLNGDVFLERNMVIKRLADAHPDEIKIDSMSGIFIHKTDKAAAPGGIDMTPQRMDLQTTGSGDGIKFNIDPVQLQELQNAPGFTPVIISIKPLESLSGFLGLNKEDVPAYEKTAAFSNSTSLSIKYVFSFRKVENDLPRRATLTPVSILS